MGRPTVWWSFCRTARQRETIFLALLNAWIRPYGPLDEIVADLERGVSSETSATSCEALSVKLALVPADAHWQLGTGERHGYAFKRTLSKLVDQFVPLTAKDMGLLAIMAARANNNLTRRAGATPSQWAHGRLPRLPAGLLSDPEGAVAHQAVSRSQDLLRIECVQTAAVAAFHEYEADNNLQKAMLRKGRLWMGPL